MMNGKSKAIRAILFVIICIMWLGLLSEIMKNKMMEGFSDVTRKIYGFYAEEKNTLDFIFLGSSRMYSAVNPAILWEEYGITSYDFCCNEQSYSITYYYLREALKTQHPKAVVVDISFGVGMEETREPLRHVNLDYLEFSPNKIEAIAANAEGKERWDYLFSIRQRHSYWYYLQENDFKYCYWRDNNPYKGYSYVEQEGEIVLPEYDYPYDMEENMELYYIEPLAQNVEWIERMAEYTREQGVDLILITVPDGSSPDFQGYYNGIFKPMEGKEGVICINYNLKMTGMHHLTTDLATSFTELLGEDLVSLYEVTDKRGLAEYEQWDETVKIHEMEMQAMELKSMSEWEGYMEKVKDGNYSIFIVQMPWICEEDKWRSIQSEFQKAGISMPEDSLTVYIGKMDFEGDLTEINNGEEEECIEGRYGGVYYKLYNNGIEVDHQGYEVRNGLRIVVYDKLLQRVVDSVYMSDNSLELKR